MPAPSWVPVVGGVPCITWLDFRSQQYWNNNAIVTDLTTILNDVNGSPFEFNPGVGLEIGTSSNPNILPSAQTSINGPPLIPAPTISPLLDVLNTLDTGGGYTAVVGVIYAGGNGNPVFFEVGSPWQNPSAPNFNLLELQATDGPSPLFNLEIGIEQLTPAFFFNNTSTLPNFSQSPPVNVQFTLDETVPSITWSFNGRAAAGPQVLPEAMNAEGAMQFLYLGSNANLVDGAAQHGSNPVGVLQYFALMQKTALPLVNFPNSFLPSTPVGGSTGSGPRLRPSPSPFSVNPFGPTPAPSPFQQMMAVQEANKWCP